MNEDDIGAAAMEPTKANFPNLASQAGLGKLTSLTGTTGSGGASGGQIQAVPGVGALDEKIHRQRAESMGKDIGAVHDARR